MYVLSWLSYACTNLQPLFGTPGSFLSIFSNEHQNVMPVDHQQACFINGICDTLVMKSNYFGPVIPKKLKKVSKTGQEGG